MSRLLATLVAGYAALALSGAGLAEDRSTRTELQQEQNQDDHAGPVAVETDSQGDQATADADDQHEQAAIDADDEDTVVIVVTDDQNEETAAAADDQNAADQDEQAATDADEDVTVVIVVPEDQDQAASVETHAAAPASQEDQRTAQEQSSQSTRNDSSANAAGVAQDAAIAPPDYSAELKKCDWAQGKRRTHCIEATKKKFGQM